MKQQEIERKFLVKGDGWRGRGEGKLFRQGYIARTQDRTVRVRVAGDTGTLTIKYRGEGIARSEFEYVIPLEEAQALLDGLAPGEIIEKVRFTFEQEGSVWEVDEFMGANDGLIVAEIELGAEDESFVKPDWLGEEVSKVSRYLNVELSRLPYTAWDQVQKQGDGK
ncbi:MAG: CYTH domain-containing protein [Mailhella sp.]|nr:CYTH domain-containing protein [Mailhella sp.]